MMFRVIQANVNRSRPALDLLIHQTKEMCVGLLLVSEPNKVPDAPNWYTSQDCSAAIYIDGSRLKFRSILAHKGSRFIAVNCGPYLIIFVYIPPSIGLHEYNMLLDEITSILGNRMNKIILGGDFNAKSPLWGPTNLDGRGLLLSNWAAERDLRIVNICNTPTCVRPQGSSIVDLTWSSPDMLPLISEWRVMKDVESLSDHVYVSFIVRSTRPVPPPTKVKARRWNLKKFDRDLFLAVLNWHDKDTLGHELPSLDAMIRWLDNIMVEACDAAAPRIGPNKPRRQAHWWSESLALLRRNCTHARRLWQRAKRKRHSEEQMQQLREAYKAARKELRAGISRA